MPFYPSQLEYRYHEHLNLALTDIAIKNIDYSIGGNNNIDLLDKNTTIGRGKTTNYTNAIKKRATNNDVYLTDVADYNEFLI
ncbi:hypothetical protein PACTADRAFT_2899 [Pachysolen tannophilus NRRL Y-2460]|uniref:Uncharacterized protein n=1 Tax=Pachysolen tannophilus NRRL Y-2460 TaxID=669874 RepID=A0A1E4TTV9_PACTA|nr:hypothetical protein PACTADRAFT_2899 [Pachysolen tannophilus NRRL Y-2460]